MGQDPYREQPGRLHVATALALERLRQGVSWAMRRGASFARAIGLGSCDATGDERETWLRLRVALNLTTEAAIAFWRIGCSVT